MKVQGQVSLAIYLLYSRHHSKLAGDHDR